MKLTVVFLFVTFLSVSASSLAQKTTIRVNNTSLKQVFREIRQKMGYTFVFNEQIVNKEGKVSLDITSDDIHEILNKCLENTSLNYEIQGDVIVILFQEKQITKEEASWLDDSICCYLAGTPANNRSDIDKKMMVLKRQLEKLY